MADGSTKTVKKEPNTPKVRFNDHTYVIVEDAGETLRVKDDFVEFCVAASAVSPANKEAREMLKGR